MDCESEVDSSKDSKSDESREIKSGSSSSKIINVLANTNSNSKVFDNNLIQNKQICQDLKSSTDDYSEFRITTIEHNENDEIIKKELVSNINLVNSPRSTTSQDNSTSSLYASQPSALYTSYTGQLNLSCETMQSKQVYKHMMPSDNDEIGIEANKCDKMSEVLKDTMFNSNNLVNILEPTTSYNSTSYSHKLKMSPMDHHEIKNDSTVYTDSALSIEKLDNSEACLTEYQNDTTNAEFDTGDLNNDTIHYKKIKSKRRQRNYRKRKNIVSDNEDSSNSVLFSDTARGSSLLDTHEENFAPVNSQNESSLLTAPLNENSRIHEGESETFSNGSNQDQDERDDLNTSWTTDSEDEAEEIPHCLKIKRPLPNWSIIPEVTNRQIGFNPLFQRRFYGSLHAVERLELMDQLQEHEGCVNTLSFNEKGNLLASGSDDLAVVIWDWATGKKHRWFQSGHVNNIFHVKWFPFDTDHLLVTCGQDGQVRLLDLNLGTSRKLANHNAASHKATMHVETPHVLVSIGEDAKVLSIDIRESKPNKLLVIKECSSEVPLYSVHFNPLNSNEFCVAGRSRYVRIYDRRKIRTPLYKLRPSHLNGKKHDYITCATYNYNGTEILASYNDEDIYLFDELMSPCLDYAHRYQGHRNHATVKGVNFFGPKSEYVMSGSDCGNIFIWDKNTEAVLQCLAGDRKGIVNCLEGHPHIPLLATSGLDYDVKIWVPSCEEPPNTKRFANFVKSNAKNRKYGTWPDPFDNQMFTILLRHIRRRRCPHMRQESTNPTQNENDDNDDEDDNNDEDDNDNYLLEDSSSDNVSDHSDGDSESDDVRLQCPVC